MHIGWLCPFINKPGIVVGAVVEALAINGVEKEYIPVILPETPIGIAIHNGPSWVLVHMGQDFFAFREKIQAECFLYDTFTQFMDGDLNPEKVEQLLDTYQGETRTASEYAVKYEPPDPSLN